MLRALVILLLAGAGLVAGCARIDDLRGKENPPSKAAFLVQAEERCAESIGRMKELGVQTLDDPVPSGDAAAYRQALLARRVGFLEVRELAHPKGEAQQIRSFVDAGAGAIDQLVERTRAEERGDRIAAATARDRAAAALVRARRLGKSLGFSTCVP